MRIDWNEIESMFEKSPNFVSLKKVSSVSQEVLNQMTVNENSVLGQIVLNTLQIIINGYLWVLGGDYMVSVNTCIKKYYGGNKLVIAYDVFGGIYAIGNGDFEGDTSNIWYFSPDSLEWEELEIDYTEFIEWVCSENIKKFYDDFTWEGIDSLTKNVKENQAILIYPFLWADECNIKTSSKEIVPLEELVAVNADYRKKLFNER